MKMRLQKYIAECGAASRRAAEKMIADGRCSVNGAVVTQMGFITDPDADEVKIDGRVVSQKNEYVYIMLNKPRGYVTTAKDQFGRPAVTDLVDAGVRLYPVGRLDYNTSGLLLLTNDGEFTHKLTHPKFTIKKTYRARLKGAVTAEAVKRFENGVDIGGYVTRPAVMKIAGTDGGYTVADITISEGKNRQIVKMCDAIGFPAVSLRRTSVGRLKLGGLREGEHRSLTPEEIKYLKTK